MRSLRNRNFDVTLDERPRDRLRVKDKLHKLRHHLARARYQILVTNDVSGDVFLLEPVCMKVPPNGYFVSNPRFPLFSVVDKISFQNRAIVSTSAVHVEKRDDAIER